MVEKENHHFLYYIFHFDKMNCKMEQTKTQTLREYLLRLFKKGE